MTAAARLASLLFVPFAATESAADGRVELWQTFAARQQAAETASVTWQKESVVLGAMLLLDDHGRLREDLALPRYPCILLLSGAMARLETQIGSFENDERGVLVAHIDAFDGTNKQTFSESKNGPWGVIQESEAFEEWQNANLFGLTLNLRPLRPEYFGTNPEEWSVESRPAILDGRSCVVLTRPIEKAIYRAYFDRDAGDLLLRYEQVVLGRVATRIDMRYDSTNEPPWLPISWVTTFGGDRSVNKVEQVSLGIDVPNSTFEIDYPAGTRISVLGSPRDAAKRGGVVSEEMFIVADKGALVPRRQAVAEESRDTGWGHWPWVFAGIGVLVLGAALLLSRGRAAAE